MQRAEMRNRHAQAILNCKNQDLIVQIEVFNQDLTDTSSTMVKSN
jgi:hypothetical protein